MAQAIKNIKDGQKFLVIEEKGSGFCEGTIVEALLSIYDIDKNMWFPCKWVGGTKKYTNVILSQKIEHLKRFKGKIKDGTSNN